MVCGVTVEAEDLYDVKHKWHRNEIFTKIKDIKVYVYPSKGQERFFQLVYQTKGAYTARTWCDRIAPVKMATTHDADPLALPKALGELAHLECWVVKQANLTSNTLANLLSDEEITRQATLQNHTAIDYLLLLHGHRCEEFEGLCCFNLSSKAENKYDIIQKIRDMDHDLTLTQDMNEVSSFPKGEFCKKRKCCIMWQQCIMSREVGTSSRETDEKSLCYLSKGVCDGLSDINPIRCLNRDRDEKPCAPVKK
ncbi:hypothetical protein DUI87_05879 [Hirundo rustica rustica]|uniref:Uncharacterized protein n=1 Tax=Hirundo rustica rustica TaxID=333673 RepID=A0A3M0KVQ4_HIRRU|nr:hypothetical protein DUI87_05879 [Hirundo rustica rustica]